VRTSDVYAGSFEALDAAFKKLDQGIIEDLKGEEKTVEKKVTGLLFHVDFAALNEAARLKRAKAILAFASVQWPVVVTAVLGSESRLAKEIAGERAAVVKQILEQARAKLT
jgi:hypothetical protein